MTENDWFFELFPDATRVTGSAQCPKCGRFAKIIRSGNDGSPLSAETGIFVEVRCKQCGDGYA